MSSESDFLNSALGTIGADRINLIDDGSKNANYCLTFWPSLRRALLRSHHWNFAERRVELAQDATPPLFEFAFSYQLPADLLKLKEFNGAALSTVATSAVDPSTFWIADVFKVEGRKLYTNDGQVKIVYVADVTDPNQWDALFYQAASTLLAADLAGAIVKDSKLQLQLKGEGAQELSLAMAVDGQEQTDRGFVVDDLIWGR